MGTHVITLAVIKFKNKFLIGKRAETKEFGANKWEFISGFVDSKETAEEIILREVSEETKINGRIIKLGKTFEMVDKEARWIVIPFLIKALNNKFTLNKKDHSKLRWVTMKELESYEDLIEIKELKNQSFIS